MEVHEYFLSIPQVITMFLFLTYCPSLCMEAEHEVWLLQNVLVGDFLKQQTRSRPRFSMFDVLASNLYVYMLHVSFSCLTYDNVHFFKFFAQMYMKRDNGHRHCQFLFIHTIGASSTI